jgi:glycosyltransferase involved in cell wall biosynthesis
VSVIVSTYNYAKYLEDCIYSILNQTYQDFELIIINDGSTDNTDDIVSRHLSNEKIIYIKQNNTGQAIATNNGILKASGDLIAFLDADDLWEPTKLEKQVKLFSRDSIGVVYSRVKFMDANGLPINKKLTGRYFIPRSGHITNFLLFENFIPYSSAVVRRECFDNFEMFNSEYKNGLDWDLWLRISTKYEFVYVDEYLLTYRVGHPGQLTSNIERGIQCANLILDRFIENNPSIAPEKVIRKALAYSYIGRGNLLRRIDIKHSTKYFIDALKKNPLKIGAYVGIFKNVFTFNKQ